MVCAASDPATRFPTRLPDNRMKSALRPVASLLLGVAILLTGQGLQGTLLPLRASLEAFGALPIGIMGAAYFSGFTLGCLKGSELLTRVGHVRVFAAMTALASAAPLLHGLVVDPWPWVLLRSLTGFCFAVLFIVIESWLNEASTNENRGMVFSTYTMITMTVFAIGQMMILLYDPSGLDLFAIAAVLVSIAVIPVVLSRSPAPDHPVHVDLDLLRLFRISPAGTLACLGSGLTNGAFWSLAPAAIIGMSGDVSLVAWFMIANVLGGAAFQWPAGYLSDRAGRRPVLIGCALGTAIVGAVLAAWGSVLGPLSMIALGVAWGAFSFPQYPVAVANANDYAEPRDYVMVSSGLLLMYGVGAVAGPLAASLMMSLIGDSALYLHTALVHLLVAGYIGFRALRREAAPDGEHLAFTQSMLAARTTSAVYEDELYGEGAEQAEAEGAVR